MRNDTCRKIVPIILFVTCSLFIGCSKDNSSSKKTAYDFSYSGSQYLGGTLHFTTTTPAGSTLLWNFGDSTSSSGSAPDHSYTRTGQFTVSLIADSDSANIICKTVYIGADSARQALIAGTRMLHKQTQGYDPVHMKDTILHYNDTSLAVFPVAPGAILFNADTLFYISSTDSTINFNRVHFSTPTIIYSAYAWSYFEYDFIKNKILYTYEYHVSAGAGNWTDTYTSF